MQRGSLCNVYSYKISGVERVSQPLSEKHSQMHDMIIIVQNIQHIYDMIIIVQNIQHIYVRIVHL